MKSNLTTKNIIEDLGEILLQVILHSKIGAEQEEFKLKDIIQTLNKK